MDVSDLVYDLRESQIRMKHANATITQFDHQKTIEIITCMINLVDDDRECIVAGEVMYTGLAELTCDRMNLYINDSDVPDDLFEISYAVGYEYERMLRFEE